MAGSGRPGQDGLDAQDPWSEEGQRKSLQDNGFRTFDIDRHEVHVAQAMSLHDRVDAVGGDPHLLHLEPTGTRGGGLSLIQGAQPRARHPEEDQLAGTVRCGHLHDGVSGAVDAQLLGEVGVGLDQQSGPAEIGEARRDGQVPRLVRADVDVGEAGLRLPIAEGPPDPDVLRVLRVGDLPAHGHDRARAPAGLRSASCRSRPSRLRCRQRSGYASSRVRCTPSCCPRTERMGRWCAGGPHGYGLGRATSSTPAAWKAISRNSVSQ